MARMIPESRPWGWWWRGAHQSQEEFAHGKWEQQPSIWRAWLMAVSEGFPEEGGESGVVAPKVELGPGVQCTERQAADW